MDCPFCHIVSGKIPVTALYEDDQIICFPDIRPQAPHHYLLIPKKHIATLNDLQAEDSLLVGHMVQSAPLIAKKLGIADDGYRIVMNCNAHGGQTVFHLHMHIIGGRSMTWPPG